MTWVSGRWETNNVHPWKRECEEAEVVGKKKSLIELHENDMKLKITEEGVFVKLEKKKT